MITCEYCLSTFSNEKSMIHHQRKAKYCLQKQNKLYLCNDCNINFNDSIKYNDHISNCPTKLKNIIKIYLTRRYCFRNKMFIHIFL